jgi:hypothetical protein
VTYPPVRIRMPRSLDRASLTKVCPRCEDEKPKSDFHTDNAKTDLCATYCKVCQREINAGAPVHPGGPTTGPKETREARRPSRVTCQECERTGPPAETDTGRECCMHCGSREVSKAASIPTAKNAPVLR